MNNYGYYRETNHLSITVHSIIHFFRKCYNKTLSVFLRKSYGNRIFRENCINISTILFLYGFFGFIALYCSLVIYFSIFLNIRDGSVAHTKTSVHKDHTRSQLIS